jgi:hypothetical protein
MNRRAAGWLFWLLAVNVATSIVHFVDNVASWSLYPEPAWNSAGATDRFWFIMTPFALAGYALYRLGWFWRSTLILQAYALMGLLVLGHYFYAPFCSLAPRIHLTVLPEAGAALALLATVAVLQLQRRESGI